MKAIYTEKAPAAVGPYSQAVVINGLVYTSGQIALDPTTGELVGTTIEEQAEQVMKNLVAILEAAGNVAAVFQAHTHHAAFRRIGGVPYCTVPSICHDDGPYMLASVYPDGGVEVRGFRGAPSLAW